MYTKGLTIAFEPRKQCGELRNISSAAAIYSMKAAPHKLRRLASAVSKALETAARNNARKMHQDGRKPSTCPDEIKRIPAMKKLVWHPGSTHPDHDSTRDTRKRTSLEKTALTTESPLDDQDTCTSDA